MSTAVFGKDSVTGSNDPVAVSGNNLHTAQYVWDTDTLSWIKQTGSGGGGGGSGGLTNAELRASPVPVTTASTNYASRVDDQTTYMYVAKAAIGNSDSSAAWQIKKIVFSGTETITTWANGADTFINAWTSRASYTYS